MKHKQIQEETIKQYRIDICVGHDKGIRRGGNLPKIEKLQLRSRKG